jgi:hypothetical protein
MHYQVIQWMTAQLKELPKFDRVLEIGSYNVNGTVRPLFDASVYIGVDLRPGPSVDVVVDGAEYESEELFDAVVCCETLEHAKNAKDIVYNAYNLLKRRGYFIATMAGPDRAPHSNDGRPDLGDEFYRNVSPDLLKKWTKKFKDVALYEFPERGDLYVIAQKG